ncbi:MAG: nitronate monooxygenase, partial [Proteobacteria bacterium]|nr:nitronate monooxygenase [Pseudomonadota bacterium]
YKEMIVESKAADIAYTSLFSGIHGSYLKGSIVNVGLDPENLPDGNSDAMDFDKADAKAWKDIWSAGQGVGNIDDIPPARDLVMTMEREYLSALNDLA